MALLLCVNVTLGLANVASYGLTRQLGYEPSHLFRLSNEANVPTWWSSAQLLMVGLVLGLVARSRFERSDRRTWALWLPCGLFLFLSLDEVAALHEAVGHRYGPAALRTGMWVSICVPIFLAAVAVVTRAIWPFLRGRRDVIRLFVTGLGIFLGSAVGLELLANLSPDGSLLTHLFVLGEEVGEMVGATVILWAAVRWAASLGLRLTSDDA